MRITSARRLNQSQRCEPPIKLWRKRGHSARVFIARTGRVCIFEIPPSLVSSARTRWHADQLGRTDDVDASVLAIVEAKDLLTTDQPMLDDPVERAADQFCCSLGPHPRC